MPKKKVLSQEEKQDIFETWKASSEEFKKIKALSEALKNNNEASTVESSSKDINTDWKDILKCLHELYDALKVPRKNKLTKNGGK
jgi:tRNA 2-selenouridine synthase SelU